MTDATARFAMPFILPGQAQKEAFHNEALALADMLLHPVVEGPPMAMPPASPQAGQCWIVAAAAGSLWTGMEHRLAAWTEGGWRFVTPVPGLLAWDRTGGHWRYWSGSAWSDGSLPAAGISVGGQKVVGARASAIATPSGGTTIDSEARAAVAAVIVALKSHGLID